jgi:hypothetical protein
MLISLEPCPIAESNEKISNTVEHPGLMNQVLHHQDLAISEGSINICEFKRIESVKSN